MRYTFLRTAILYTRFQLQKSDISYWKKLIPSENYYQNSDIDI